MRKLAYGLVAVLGVLSTAAKGSGCSAEYTDDGSSDAWATAPAPSPGPAQPMTCAFLSGDNCWKRVVAKIEACAGDVKTSGRFSEDRRVCAAPSGGKLELGGPVSTPAPGTTSVVGTDWRISSAGGETCAIGKILGVGRSLIDAQGEVVTFESVSLLEYRVTCPDGSTFTNEGSARDDGGAAEAGAEPDAATPDVEDDERVCSTFGLDYLAKRTPGVLLSCEGTRRSCKLALWGGPAGETEVATCGW